MNTHRNPSAFHHPRINEEVSINRKKEENFSILITHVINRNIQISYLSSATTKALFYISFSSATSLIRPNRGSPRLRSATNRIIFLPWFFLFYQNRQSNQFHFTQISGARWPTHAQNKHNTQGRDKTVHVCLQWDDGKGMGASGGNLRVITPPTGANGQHPSYT